MSKRLQLRQSVKAHIQRHNSGSFSTRAVRKELWLKLADDLYQVGIQLTNIAQLKAKHVVKVIQHWHSQHLSAGTLKNRMAHVRHLWQSLLKHEKLPSNDQLWIAKRSYVPKRNRAVIDPDFSSIKSPQIRASLELQRVFGLRREESLKIKPFLADRGSVLELQPTWCKGGRGRFVPIRTEEQRYWLEQAKQLADDKTASLIPSRKNYIQHRYVYEKQAQKAGLKNLHGLRHAYAQRRYQELTGWPSPITGGPITKHLTREQRKLDHLARLTISEELGHSRAEIVKNYLG